jgi:hypothetical protein
MRINELELNHFGKFHGKKVTFDAHVNLVYGLNESGKTTLWYFILGMFFGFFKPYIKTRRYLDIHAKYQPWESSQYCGSMVLTDEEMGRTVRIYRNFRQGEEEVTVHDEQTGEEITGLYDMHPVFRLPDIAKKHLNISYFGYINMGAISQLGHETDENLIVELKEAVVNALSSKTLNVSMHKIQQELKTKKERIGSKKKTSSIYAKMLDHLDDLYKQRQRVLEEEKNLFDLIAYQIKLDVDLENVREQLRHIQLYEEYTMKCHQRDRLHYIEDLGEKQKGIEDTIIGIRRNTEYDLEDVYGAKEKYKEKVLIENELDALEQEQRRKQSDDDRIQGEIKETENQKRFFEKKKKKWVKNLLGAFTGLTIFAFFLGMSQQQWGITTALGGLFVFECLISMLWHRRTKQNHQEWIRIEEKAQWLYEKLTDNQEAITQIIALKRQKHQHVVDLNEYLMPIMGPLEIEGINDFEERIDEFQNIKNYQVDLIRIEEQEKGLLHNQSFSEIQHQVNSYDFETVEKYIQGLSQEQLSALNNEKNLVLEQEQQLTYEHIKVTTQLKESRKKYQSLADLDEEIQASEQKMQDYNHQLSVYQIIDDTLEEITRELKYEFSPSMNNTLSQLLAKITSGKYNQVKITPDMEILFKDPLTHKMQDVSNLSRGTIDLFYIIFRYTIAKWSHQGQSIPFVLDEVFAYFDDQRLAQSMDVLLDFKEQVILFTCQEREKQLAEEKQIKIITL